MPPEPPPEDRALVRRFLAGDEDAFRALYRRHTPLLYGLALRLAGGDPDEAADAVQDAWVRAARRMEGFRWESRLSTWLCGLVVNCRRERARSRSRRERREVGVAAGVPDAPGPAPAPGLALDVERALAGLPDGYRTVLVLYGIHGYSHHEIADLLGVAPGTSKSQLSRARAALRDALGIASTEGP